VEVPLDLDFSEASEVLATVDLLISFNVNSQAAARTRWLGGRVLFITSKPDDVWRYGYRDMLDARAGVGWAVLVADALDRFEALVSQLLEHGRVRLARDLPTGSERIEAWMAAR
jgi:hypothetical protein